MEDIEKKGLENTWNDRKMWNQMRMSQRDLSDVTGYTYTYLFDIFIPISLWVRLATLSNSGTSPNMEASGVSVPRA
jgi:hypothetical protein